MPQQKASFGLLFVVRHLGDNSRNLRDCIQHWFVLYCLHKVPVIKRKQRNHMEIGQKIKQLRFQCSMTQEQLATQLGISAQSVSKWETSVSHN